MSGPLLFFISSFTLAGVYALLSLALNYEAGIDGLWDLGIVSFFALGAFAYAIITTGPANSLQKYHFGFSLPVWIGVIGAACAGVFFAFLIGKASLRLRNEYYLIVTFAFAEVIREVLTNEAWLTNGTRGLYRLPQPFKSVFDSSVYPVVLLVVVLCLVGVAYLAIRQVSKRTFGRSLNALRENEALAMTAGIAPYRYHIRSAMMAACLAGVAGAAYVWFNTVAMPQQFTSSITFVAWTAVVIGGIGHSRGVILGAFLLIVTEDALRLFEVSTQLAVRLASARIAFIGIILMLVLRFRPKGIWPERRPRFKSRTAALSEFEESQGAPLSSAERT